MISILWDVITGFRGWSVDYVLPILSSSAATAIFITAKVKRLDAQDYIMYLATDCILGIVCFILLLTGAVRIVIPSAISFGVSVIFLAFLCFFEGRALIGEIQRRLHL